MAIAVRRLVSAYYVKADIESRGMNIERPGGEIECRITRACQGANVNLECNLDPTVCSHCVPSPGQEAQEYYGISSMLGLPQGPLISYLQLRMGHTNEFASGTRGLFAYWALVGSRLRWSRIVR